LVKEGNRDYATLVLASAMRQSGVSKDDAISQLLGLWRKWNKLGHSHKEKQIISTVLSAYKKNYDFCRLARNYGFCKPDDCLNSKYIAHAVQKYNEIEKIVKSEIGGDNENQVIDCRIFGSGKTQEALSEFDTVVYTGNRYRYIEEKAHEFGLTPIYGRTKEIRDGEHICAFSGELEQNYSKIGNVGAFCSVCDKEIRDSCPFITQFEGEKSRVGCVHQLTPACREAFNIKNLILDDLSLFDLVTKTVTIPKAELEDNSKTLTEIENYLREYVQFVTLPNGEIEAVWVEDEDIADFLREIKIAFSDYDPLTKFDKYLFSWDDIPEDENDNERLLKFLKDDLGVDWANNAETLEVFKPDSETLQIFKGENSAKITIDEERKGATLRVKLKPNLKVKRKVNLKVKKENNKLNIYFDNCPRLKAIL